VKICIVFISLIFAGVLHAASFYKEIENITGKNTYVANQKIIKTLFKNKKIFYTGGHLDYPRVLAILKENHLLNVKISRSTAITLSFATRQQHPVAFIRLVKSALNELGYSRIDVLKVIHEYKLSTFYKYISLYSVSLHISLRHVMVCFFTLVPRGMEIVFLFWNYFFFYPSVH